MGKTHYVSFGSKNFSNFRALKFGLLSPNSKPISCIMQKRDRGIFFFFFIRLVLSLYCIIYFYNKCILLQFPVSAITWGHNDKRLFVATGNEIHIGWVSPTIGSLQLLSRLKIHNSLRNEDQVQLLPLPCRLQNLIGMLFTQTIRVCI